MGEDIQLLHIYGQGQQHDDVTLVGNRAALKRLRYTLGLLIDGTLETAVLDEFFAADGEGYSVKLKIDDSDWQGDAWQGLVLPYAEEASSDE